MRRLLTFIISFVAIFIVIAILLTTLLPTIVGTDWGRKQAISWVNRTIPGSIEIRRLNLNWLKGQTIEGFLLKDPEGQPVLEFEKFTTEAPLWQLIQCNFCLGFTQVEDLNAAITTTSQGETNIQKALGIKNSRGYIPSLPSTIVLSDIQASSYLFVPNRPLSLEMRGDTRQENLNGSFNLSLLLNGLSASDWENLKRDPGQYLSLQGNKEAKFKGSIINFPVDLLDRLAALHTPQLNGLFRSLLGDKLNLNIEKEASEEGLLFNLSVATPLMQGGLKGLIDKNNFSLKETARFLVKLAPHSINPFIHPSMELLEPSEIEATLSELNLPLTFLEPHHEFEPCKTSFQGALKLTETQINIPSIGQLQLSQLVTTAKCASCDKQMMISLSAKAKQGNEPFALQVDTTLDKPANIFGFGHQLTASLQTKASLSHFPLEILPFIHDYPEWNKIIGPHVDAKLELQPKEKDGWLATLSLQTPTLSINEARFLLQDEVKLLSPTQIKWILGPDCFLLLSKKEEFALDHPCSLNVFLKELQVPLNAPQSASFELETSIPQLRLAKLSDWGSIQFTDLKMKILGQTLKNIDSRFEGKLSLLSQRKAFSSLTPEPLAFQFNSKWKVGEKGTLEMNGGNLQVANSITNVQAEARIDSEGRVELTKPILATYSLTPAALQTISTHFDQKWPTLQEPAFISLTIDPTNFSLKPLSLQDFYLQGMLKVKKFSLNDTSGHFPTLENLLIPILIDIPRNNVNASIKGVAYSNKEKKPSQVSANLQFWLPPNLLDLSLAKSEVRLNFAGLPTSVVSLLSGAPDLLPIIGPILDLNLKAFYDPTKEKPGYWDMAVDSTHFHADLRFKFNDSIKIADEIKRPVARLTLTPEGYRHIQKLLGIEDDRQLTSPLSITAKLDSLNIPLKKNWMEEGSFDLQLSTTEIKWQNANFSPLRLTGSATAEKLKDRLLFSFEAEGGHLLKLDGKLEKLFDDQNNLKNWQSMTIKAHAEGKQLPLPFIEGIFLLNDTQSKKIRALFGNVIDLDTKGELRNDNGFVEGIIRGNKGRFQIDGKLNEGLLTLNKPLQASITVTPQLIQTFFAPNVPLLSTAQGAEEPLTCTIDPSQFSCPLIPFQLDKLSIGKGTLNLGKISFRNEGELKSILSMIQPLTDPYFTIWFTPIYFDAGKGILNLKRFDMLVANLYTLANWGSINLSSHQANFILGLTAQTLQTVFGIQGLEESYILQIPLHSAKGKVEVDKKKATARIGALLAQTHGGDKGKLLGNILDMVLSEKGDPYPAPTTNPFPWKEQFDSSTKTGYEAKQSPSGDDEQIDEGIEKKKKKKTKSSDKKDLNELKGQALKLLDQWIQ